MRQPQFLLRQPLLAAALAGTVMISGAAHALTLEQAQQVAISAAPSEAPSPEKDLRMKALQEAAQSYGARSALAETMKIIRNSVFTTAANMDAIYNFGVLMMIDQVDGEEPVKRPRLIVPPVLTQAENNVELENDSVLHITDKAYKIIKQARFSLASPSWRDYLIREQDSQQSIAPPHPSLLPRTDDEKVSFKKWVAEGWTAGERQAYQIHESDLNRLSRDFNGMVLYHELVREKKVSLPFVSINNRGITGEGDSLNINDITLRITVLPAFNKDGYKWQPQAH